MVNGNLSLTLGSHKVQALAGPVGVDLAYNSIQGSTASGANFGLQGDYYLDPGGAHTFPSGPVGSRVDATVDLSSQFGTPVIGGLPPTTSNYMVRWTGTVSLPAGTWDLGGESSGGLRIYLDGGSTAIYDDWAGSNNHTAPTFAPTSLAGGHQYKIRIEHWGGYTHWSNNSWAQLWVRQASSTTATPNVVPDTWLTPTASALPPGWSMTPANLGGVWSSLRDEGSQVVVTGTTGVTADFMLNPDGTYRSPPGNLDYLSTTTGNQLELSTVDGSTYLFNPDGTLASVTSAPDDLHPASLRYIYAANPLRLTTIADPVSTRSVTIAYGGDPACPATNTAPDKMLCRITTWDNQVTDVSYNTNGQIAAISGPIEPQRQQTLFGYDPQNRLNGIRDALAVDYIASGANDVPAACVSGTGCPLDTTISYDTSNRVTSVTQPAPTPGAARPQRTYNYSAGPTTMRITGQDSGAPWTRQVTYDNTQQILTSTRWGESPVRNAWDSAGRLIAAVTPAGLETATIYDANGNPTDVFGPAPASCFTATWPTGASNGGITNYVSLTNAPFTCGASTIPHTKTGYDEDILGLAATYWSNGQFAGPPSLHGQASIPSSACNQTRAYYLCMNWPAGSPPVPSDSSGQFTIRAKGALVPSPSGNNQIELQALGHATLYIDGISRIDVGGPSASGPAPWATTISLALDPNQVHQIVIDYTGVGSASQGNGFAVYLNGSMLSNGNLQSMYHLPTTVTDPDGLRSSTFYGAQGPIGPWYGLATQVCKPDSNGLCTLNGYETPSTRTWLRKTSTTLPAGNTTTDTYYGGTDGPAAAACNVDASTPQGGKLMSLTDPAPTPGSPARVQQFIYDITGRQVGRRVGTIATITNMPWVCNYFDARGRITKQTTPATASASARTVTYTYSPTNPLSASVTDDSGITVSATVDLLGRLVSYTDNGQMTTYTYNQAGELMSTTGPQGTLNRTYTVPGQLSTVVMVNGGTATTLATASYNLAGQLTKVVYAGNTTGTFTNDNAGRPSGATFASTAASSNGVMAAGTPVAGSTATYSLAGRVNSYAYPADNTTSSYTYDRAGRLITAAMPGRSDTYSYGSDAMWGTDDSPTSLGCAANKAGHNSNRTIITKTPTDSSGNATGATTTAYYCYNNADQMTGTTTDPNTNISNTPGYSYDARGNQTNDASTSLRWDSSDRLVSTTTSSVTTGYTYDPLDRVTRIADNGTGTRYLYNGYSDVPIAATTDSGIITQQLIPLPGGVRLTLDVTTAPATQVWSYADLHGDTNATLNAQGQGTTSHYDPWGAALTANPPLSPNAGTTARMGAYGAAGKLTTNSTAYILLGARALNPSEGRFLSIDPIFGGCANAYVYVSGDPINTGDLGGRASLPSCKGFDVNTPVGEIAGGIGSGNFHFTYSVPADGRVPATGHLNMGLGLTLYGSLMNGPHYWSLSSDGHPSTGSEFDLGGGSRPSYTGDVRLSGTGTPSTLTLTLTLAWVDAMGDITQMNYDFTCRM